MKEPVNPLLFYTFIKTKEEALLFKHSLEMLRMELFKSQQSANDILARMLPATKITLLATIAANYTIDIEDKLHLQELLIGMNEALDVLPIAHVIIAVDPSVHTVAAMHQWFFRVDKQAVLLDLDVDPSLIAGSIISFNGRLHDYSLRKELGEMIETLS